MHHLSGPGNNGFAPNAPAQGASESEERICTICYQVMENIAETFRCLNGDFFHHHCIEHLNACPTCGLSWIPTEEAPHALEGVPHLDEEHPVAVLGENENALLEALQQAGIGAHAHVLPDGEIPLLNGEEDEYPVGGHFINALDALLAPPSYPNTPVVTPA